MLLQQIKDGASLEVLRETLKQEPVDQVDENGRTALFYFQDPETTELLLDHGLDVNHRDNFGNTAIFDLMDWDNSNRIPVARAMLEREPDLNTRNREGETPLHYAYPNEMVFLLIENGAHPNFLFETEMEEIMWDMSTQELRFLLDHGLDSNLPMPESGCNMLHFFKTPEHIQLLVENGADINNMDPDGKSILWRHVAQDNYEIVKYLLNQHADPNLSHPITAAKSIEMAILLEAYGASLRHPGPYPFIAVMVSVDVLDMVKIWVNKGLILQNITLQLFDHVYTLDMAQYLVQQRVDTIPALFGYLRKHLEHNPEIVQFLLDHGANPNYHGPNHTYPLSFANSTAVTRLLLCYGADTSNMSIIWHQMRHAEPDSVDLLLEHGAPIPNQPYSQINSVEMAKVFWKHGAREQYPSRAKGSVREFLYKKLTDLQLKNYPDANPILQKRQWLRNWIILWHQTNHHIGQLPWDIFRQVLELT